MGVKPAAIAGTSIGAVIGAGYAAGMSGREMRRHLITLAHDRGDVLRRVMARARGRWSELLGAGFGNPLVVDAEQVLRRVPAELLPEIFAELKIPLTVDRDRSPSRARRRVQRGPLQPALAASIALPGLMRPVEVDGRVLVDGGAPIRCRSTVCAARPTSIVAVDVSGGLAERRGVPDPWESLFATISVMGHTIVTQKLKHGAPDLLLRPNVGIFRMLDFFQASAILRAAEPIKAEVREKLSALL